MWKQRDAYVLMPPALCLVNLAAPFRCLKNPDRDWTLREWNWLYTSGLTYPNALLITYWKIFCSTQHLFLPLKPLRKRGSNNKKIVTGYCKGSFIHLSLHSQIGKASFGRKQQESLRRDFGWKNHNWLPRETVYRLERFNQNVLWIDG